MVGRKSKLNGNEVSLSLRAMLGLVPRHPPKKRARGSGHETMPCQCHTPAFDLWTNDATWSTSSCPPSDERTSEITVECSL